MAPRTRPKSALPLTYASTPEADYRVCEGIAASERDEAIELTPQELAEYGETGALSERVERWLTSPD
jgi:hypothetical protein